MASNPFQQGVPGPNIVNKDGGLTGPWFAFFVSLWERTGGASGSIAIALNTISTTIGATLYQNGPAWTALNPGAQYTVMQMGVEFPSWGFLSGQNFGLQSANSVFIGPVSGPALAPTFRPLASSDLSPIAGQYPGTATNDNATVGYVGEYIFDEVTSPLGLSSGAPTDIASINLSAGDWDVWGNFASAPAGSTTQTIVAAWISQTSATDPGPPNNGAYVKMSGTIPAGAAQVLGVPTMRVSLAAPGTVYLSASVTFAVSTLTGTGFLGARRRR